MALSKKRQAFVEHYLRCWNASEAARLAGYSEKTAGSIGHENLKIPEIQDAIQARLDELKMSADEVLLRLADQARSTMADFIDPERGEIDLKRAEQRGKLHQIRKFTHSVGEKTENTSIELYDAQAALVQIGRAHGLFTDNQTMMGRDGGPIKSEVSIDLSGMSSEQLAALAAALED